ncbi:MAG: putative bifunctional diguanylate cyclase/phosphodiesterase [Frankia sp.]
MPAAPGRPDGDDCRASPGAKKAPVRPTGLRSDGAVEPSPDGGWTLSRGGFLVLLAGCAAVFVAAAVSWPISTGRTRELMDGIVTAAVTFVAALICLWSALRNRGLERRWRGLFSLALAAGAVALGVRAGACAARTTSDATLSGTDLTFLAPAIVMIAGLLLFPGQTRAAWSLNQRVAGSPVRLTSVFRRTIGGLDLFVVTAAVTILMWAVAFGHLADRGATTTNWPVAVVCLGGCVVLIVALVWVASVRRPLNPGPFFLIAAGIGVFVLAQTALFDRFVSGADPDGSAWDLGFVAAALLISLATVAPPGWPARPRAVFRRSAPTPLIVADAWGNLCHVALVGAGLVLLAQVASGHRIQVGEVVCVVVLVGLVVAHQTVIQLGTDHLLRDTRGELRLLADHDLLTGLANRSDFERRLEDAAARRRDEGGSIGLLRCDLDDFTRVNGTLGHRVGDELLIAVADRLRTCVRPGDCLARVGGDEFAVLVAGAGRDPRVVGDRILTAMSRPLVLAGRDYSARLSIGLVVATAEEDDLRADDLLRRGDAALEAAKCTRSGALVTYERTTGRPDRTDYILTELEFALAGDPAAGIIEPHYQPIVDLHSGRTVGYEALARWSHPDRGLILPGRFVPLAEAAGLAPSIDRAVLAAVCRDIAMLRAERAEPLSVHVNISAVWAGDQSLVDAVWEELDRYGLPPSILVVEITETVRIPDLLAASDVLGRLARLGVGIGLDDVGAGYSSVSTLHRLPFTIGKLDGTLVGPLPVPPRTQLVRDALVTMMRSVGMTVAAEGIETPAEARAVTRIGCQLGQGRLYGFARPIDALRNPAPAGVGAGS